MHDMQSPAEAQFTKIAQTCIDHEGIAPADMVNALERAAQAGDVEFLTFAAHMALAEFDRLNA